MVRGRARRHVPAAAALAAILTLAGASAPRARADYTETFCTGGAGPAPWTLGIAPGGTPWDEQINACEYPGGSLSFGLAAAGLPPGSRYGAGITAPAGLTFTHVTLQWTAQPVNSSAEFMDFGYDSTILDEGLLQNPIGTRTADYPLPDASTFWTRFDCDDANGCPYGDAQHTESIGAMAVTLHDTGAPTVTPTGGSLATTKGTVKGNQTLLFAASASGSGVAKAIVSLGSTPVGETDSVCQTPSLAPCPATTSGAIAADTRAVPDGTYPVILTAVNASGNATPVQAGTVTVRNHSGSTTVRGARRSRHGRRAVDIHVVFHWDVQRRTTLLRYLTVGSMSRRAVIHLTCAGRRCPFHRLTTTAHGVTRLKRRLAHRRFRPGQTVHYLATAPHRAPQRATMTVRRTRLPRVVLGR